MAAPSCLALTAGGYAGCDAADWIAAWAADRGFDADTRLAMRLCVEEMVTNLTMHGLVGAPRDHLVDLSVSVQPGEARVTMVDDGMEFDITAAADPGRQGTIESATIGGRGIRLIRAFATKLEWRRLDGRNHTTLVFKV